MSSARTTITLVEWAGRARRARSVEMVLANLFGDAVDATPDPAMKAVLARHARHHAFHAELWDGVVPVLHDVTVSDAPADDPGLAVVAAALHGDGAVDEQRIAAAFGSGIPALIDVYRNWAGDTSVVAERPIMRVLDLVLRDEEFDVREGAPLAGS